MLCIFIIKSIQLLYLIICNKMKRLKEEIKKKGINTHKIKLHVTSLWYDSSSSGSSDDAGAGHAVCSFLQFSK